MTEIPQLPKRCQVCHHENKFAIQKLIDKGEAATLISKEYNISTYAIKAHIMNNHRSNLIAFGEMGYILRKKSVDAGLVLADYINKWSASIQERQPETIKDSDALKALELFSKIQGTLVDKHEIVIKRSIETALAEFLSSDLDDETKHSEKEERKDVAANLPKAAES